MHWMVSSPLHCDSSSMQSFRPTLVNEGAMGRHSIDLDAFSIKRVLHSHLSKKAKRVPRVRIELTAFRLLVFVWLWDWRATYCATEAHGCRGQSHLMKLWGKHVPNRRKGCKSLHWTSSKRVWQCVAIWPTFVEWNFPKFCCKLCPARQKPPWPNG